MMIFEDTIAAISTPPGTGALAVVRLSGSRAFEIAQKIFLVGRKKSSFNAEFRPEDLTHQATYGFVINPETREHIDEVVITPFKRPQTYTGEDLVEITCHGGPVVTAEILSLILNLGARLARRGEFTERAFLSGRIDLTQAEAVLDIIQAKTTRQGRRALSALEGGLGARIKHVRTQLVELLTRIVAGIDFPEEIGDAPEPEVHQVVRHSIDQLDDLSRTARSGRFLRDGLKIAIVGRPNAGKSSLLNQLLKFERAIVTDIPGTTRDSLEELLDLNGVPVLLIDTAGIRPTEDQVELIGIERTKKAINESDLVLFVVDLKEGWDEPEQEIADLLPDKPFLLVGNKLDIASKVEARLNYETRDPISRGGEANYETRDPISRGGEANYETRDPISRGGDGNYETRDPIGGVGAVAKVFISAKTGERIDDLTAAIEGFVFQDEQSREGPSLNARQGELCIKAAKALHLVETTLAAGYPQDCLATDLKTAVDALSEISGESVSEEVITQVFATFCIGK
jgi:tRNA modification GTPase